jgi:hypothetical protein
MCPFILDLLREDANDFLDHRRSFVGRQMVPDFEASEWFHVSPSW